MMDISHLTMPSGTSNNSSSRPPPPKTKSNEEICVHSPDMPRPDKGPIISPRRSPLSNSSGDSTPPSSNMKYNSNKLLSRSTHNTPTTKSSAMNNNNKLLSHSTHNTPVTQRRRGSGRDLRSEQQKPRHNSKEEYKSPTSLHQFISPRTSLQSSSLHGLDDGHGDVVVDVSKWHKANKNKSSKHRKQKRRHSQPQRTSSSDVLTCPFMEDALARRIQALARVFIAKCRLQNLKLAKQAEKQQQREDVVNQEQLKKKDMPVVLESQPLQPPAKASATKQVLLDGRSAKMFVNVRASDLTMSDFGSVISLQSAMTQNTFATYNSAAVSAATHNTDDTSSEDVSLGSFVANADALKRQTNQSKDLVNDMLSKSYHHANYNHGNKQNGQKQCKQQNNKKNHYSLSNLISPRWDVSSKNKVSAAAFRGSGIGGAVVDGNKSYASTTSSFQNPCFDPNISTTAIHGGRSSGGFGGIGTGLMKIPRRRGSLQNQLEKQRQKLSTSNHDKRRNLLPPIKSLGSQVTTISDLSGGDDSSGRPVMPRHRTIAIDDEDDDVGGNNKERIDGSEVPLSSMLGSNFDDFHEEEEDLSDKLQPLRPATMSGMANRDNPVRRPIRTLTPDASLCSNLGEKWREQQEKYGGRDIFDDDDEEEDTYDEGGNNYNYEGNRYDDYYAHEYPPDRKMSLNSWSGSTITSAPFMPTAKTTLVQQSGKTMSTTPVKVSLDGGIKIESGEEIILVVQEDSSDGHSDLVNHAAAMVEDNVNDSPVKRPQRKLSPMR